MRHPNCRGEGAIRLQRSGTGKRKFRKKPTTTKTHTKRNRGGLLPEPRESQLGRCIPPAPGLCIVINVHRKLR